ncbi:WYL domain-containing protein [Streptomyces sioyaensis]|uniref:WYL domain-containing transcriptional regulator n=1 Tax=Streptomyces sioyaensis TaxID=67364 RepID=A0A4Q1QU37_9ACTN|nr:WYL domain-containing protein [Streptomyces sioyaensis]MBM4796096.1 WYL domain-containing protein [Streptomyces sioyaensis]RXS57261.1 WYL domain-containing transcriptional regulator [Streptomyces sioyaensis]
MRAARLIKMVLLLQARPSMTAAELARELEVSERTVARDVLSLSEAGVPVYADRGRAGGYRLIGGYRTRLTGLARSEAEALFLSGVPTALREMGLADAASAARLKVSAALRPELRDAASGAAQRFHLDAPAWYQEPETPELLPAIADAVWDDRRITARYLRKDTEVARELEPYGLVLKAGVWYLAARVEGEYRVYRVDRFTAVTAYEGAGATAAAGASDGRFRRDESFDLPAFWAERAAQFARSILREEVVLRLSARGVHQLPYVTERAAAREAIARAQAAGGPDEQGRLTVTLAVESAEVAYAQLLSLGPEGELLRPADLRERLATAARRTAALYD